MDNRLHRRHPLVQFIFDHWIYIVIGVLMWQLPQLLGDYFDQPLQPRRPQGNQPIFWMGVMIQLYIFIILAVSYNLIFGFGGIVSFGHALFFGIGVYSVVIFMVEYAYSLLTSAALGLSFAALLGLFTALAAFRIKGVYFAMFTLALATVFHDMVRINLFKFITAGDDGRTLRGLPEWINPVSNRLTFYYVCAFFAALTFVLVRSLINSPTGAVIYAIRENEQRAETLGYNIVRYKTLVLVVGSILGAVGGMLHAIFTRQAEPSAFAIERTTDPLFMMIIGGIGTHPGPVIGAIILHLGETFFRKPALQIDLNFILFHLRGEVNTVEIWRFILGAVFVLIVLLIPKGVVGQVHLIWVNIRRWARQFVYDPLLRRYPHVATWMQPFTGEPPEVAYVLAERSQHLTLRAWATAHPVLVAYLIGFAVAIVAGLVTWDSQGFFAWLLFGWLLITPFAGVHWLLHHYSRLSDNVRRFAGQFLR